MYAEFWGQRQKEKKKRIKYQVLAMTEKKNTCIQERHIYVLYASIASIMLAYLDQSNIIVVGTLR